MSTEDHNGEKSVPVKRGRVDSLSLYEITEDELDQLAIGSPSSLHLNFAVFFLSIAFSFLITLLSTKIESDRTFTVFVVILVVTTVAGSREMLLWWRAHKTTPDIIKRIRDRLPSEEPAPPKKGKPAKKGADKGKSQKATPPVPPSPSEETESDNGYGTGEEKKKDTERG
jgi:hypothetical protein